MCLISTILGTTRIQTHLPFTAEIAIDAINKYKVFFFGINEFRSAKRTIIDLDFGYPSSFLYINNLGVFYNI
jgi:hypothetical protein